MLLTTELIVLVRGGRHQTKPNHNSIQYAVPIHQVEWFLFCLQLTSSFDNFSQHKVFHFANLVTWDNHDQITHIGYFCFIVCHKFACILQAFVIFGVDAVSVNCNIDRLLHLVGHDRPHQCTSRILSRWCMNEFPTRNGGRISKLLIRHVGNVSKNVVVVVTGWCA